MVDLHFNVCSLSDNTFLENEKAIQVTFMLSSESNLSLKLIFEAATAIIARLQATDLSEAYSLCDLRKSNVSYAGERKDMQNCK